ncbi:hypothetical protein ACMC56_02830 [Campylobacterota bacterium DY0563]
MIKKINNIYNELSKPQLNSKKIGLFITLCSIFGGLLVAYLAMSLLTFIIPGTIGEAILIPLLFNTLAWAISALWIALSPSKIIALKRTFFPILLFSIAIIILYTR